MLDNYLTLHRLYMGDVIHVGLDTKLPFVYQHSTLKNWEGLGGETTMIPNCKIVLFLTLRQVGPIIMTSLFFQSI